jgi:Tol biopolymer transport system component
MAGMTRTSRVVAVGTLATFGAWVCLCAAAGAASAGATTRIVSVTRAGHQGGPAQGSFDPSVSADGHLVAFDSYVHLINSDTNGALDVWVKDLDTGKVTVVSVASNGHQGDDRSYAPHISGNGRFVAFTSDADNLVPGDTHGTGVPDAYVHDLLTGRTVRVSVSSTGAETTAGFASYAEGVSGDGRFVVFESDAPNLVPGDTNNVFDVFVRDRRTKTTRRVDVTPFGLQSAGTVGAVGGSISGDGRFVAFMSDAPDLVSGDTNGVMDVFVRDRRLHLTRRVSVSSAGVQGDGASGSTFGPGGFALSASGRFVVFLSAASNLVPGDSNGFTDVFVRDRHLHTTSRVDVNNHLKQANGNCVDNPSISADGHLVAFDSDATNLVPGDTAGHTDVFVRERAAGRTVRASVNSAGAQGNDSSSAVGLGAFGPSIAANGLIVAFVSNATNLVRHDANNNLDVFAHGPLR